MGSSISHPVPNESEVTGLKISDFELVRLMGKGSCGEVYAARFVTQEHLIALKIVKRRSDQHPQDHWQEIQREIRIMKTLHRASPFTLQFYGSFPHDSGTALMLELVGGGDLKSKLLPDRETGLDIPIHEDDARFYVAEIACALEALRVRKIVHRDLKLENILLTRDGHIKIADFGLATFLTGGHAQTPCGANHVRSPQMLRGEPYTAATDWYALGVGMFELVVGYEPHYHIECPYHSPIETCPISCLARLILRNKVNYPPFLSADCKNLIGWLMRDDEKDRIKSLAGIKSHPWLRGIDWESFQRGNGQV